MKKETILKTVKGLQFSTLDNGNLLIKVIDIDAFLNCFSSYIVRTFDTDPLTYEFEYITMDTFLDTLNILGIEYTGFDTDAIGFQFNHYGSDEANTENPNDYTHIWVNTDTNNFMDTLANTGRVTFDKTN